MFLVLAGLCIFTSTLFADVKLPAIFGDHMVLQQKKTVAVWGWAEPGEKIKVKGDWQWFAASTKAGKDGKWKVKIRTPKAGGPHTLTITGNNEIILNDILMGEVWICSGQSNMEWRMNMLGTDRGADDIAAADHPQIRLFTVKKTLATDPLEDVEGTWQICSSQTVENFSAVGYYFGKNLNQALDAPIGLISTNWGGTVAEAWTSKDTLMQFDRFKQQLAQLSSSDMTAAQEAYGQALQNWENKVAAKDPGMQENWFKPDFDDSSWNEMELPALWTGTELETTDGIVWFRRTTNLPPSWARHDMELHLGPIDDIATVWFNGINLGTTFGYDKPRIYQVPASVSRIGKNSIVVRVADTGYEGGFSGKEEDMRIGPRGADIKTCATVAKTWKYKVASKKSPPAAPVDSSKFNQNSPTALYNAMIAPLIPFRIAGAIWYQGESNCYDPILYRTLFPAMITDWRQQWNQGKFPFYYVQIAPYQYNANTYSQALREAQMMTLDTAKNVGMAVTMDIAEEKDIHPRNKHDVGDRLARWALAKTYAQKNITYSGPLYQSMKVEGDTIRILFDHVDGGLVAKDGKLTDFMIAGEDKKFVPAEAVIDGDTILISSNAIKAPVAVRYGWSNWVDGSLFNGAGLPASSFRTDDWPLQ